MSYPNTEHPQATACPSCGAMLENSSPPDGSDLRPPVVGDATICMYCAALLIYADESLTLRRPTLEEAEQAEARPDYATSMAIVRALMRRRMLALASEILA
jgi:hypothetical protein